MQAANSIYIQLDKLHISVDEKWTLQNKYLHKRKPPYSKMTILNSLYLFGPSSILNDNVNMASSSKNSVAKASHQRLSLSFKPHKPLHAISQHLLLIAATYVIITNTLSLSSENGSKMLTQKQS